MADFVGTFVRTFVGFSTLAALHGPDAFAAMIRGGCADG